MHPREIPRKARARAATSEQLQMLVHELAMLYLDYWSTDRNGNREAADIEVADYASLFRPRHWYTTLLQTVVPVWTPGAKKARCWSVPGVSLEVAEGFLYLFIEVETGRPYVLLSGQPVADHFIPEAPPVRLTARDVEALSDQVGFLALRVQALTTTEEYP